MRARRPLAVLIVGAVAVIPCAALHGQTPASRKTASTAAAAGQADLPAQVFTRAPATTAQPQTAATDAAKKQEHLQKINQLTFDRRPSAIFKAWSTPRAEALKSTETAPPAAVTATTSAARLRRLQQAQQVQPGVIAAVPTTAAAPTTTLDPFDLELRGLQYDVTLGDWPAVKAFLSRLPKDEAKAAYDHLIQGLSTPSGIQVNQQAQVQMQLQMQLQMQMNMGMQFGVNPGAPLPQRFMMDRNVFSNADVFGLAIAAPDGLDDERVRGLGQILRQALEAGNVVEDFVARQRRAARPAGPGSPLSDRQAAKLLMAADRTVESAEFLPTPEKAEADNDREALNLLARHYLAIYARDKKAVQLERAWKVTQAALAAGKIDREQKDEAIRRAVELTPQIRAELGRTWLEESFTRRPERGMEILAAIGAVSAQGLQTHAFDTDFRKKSLELQKLAVEALLRKAPQLSRDWARTLALLAEAWLREAEFSYHYDYSTSLRPRMQYDVYGNVYYSSYDPFTPDMMARQRGMPMAVKVGDVVENMPGDDWLKSVDEGIKPKFATVFAQLYLKVSEEEKAFPFIEQLARTNPRQAKELVDEFIRVWTKNHDPNAQQLRRSRFFYVYGFDNRAEGIPLTRSKQERNLVELAELVKKLRALPIAELDEKLLAKAFTTCHSSAEVYRLDAIEKVFGSFDALKPLTLAELVQQMRGNLLGVWRQPAEQEKNKTRRREKDIRAEVFRGYEVAKSVIERAMRKHPEHWALLLARATLMHDENNYRQELERSSEYAPRRQAAFAEFQRAARRYLEAVPALEQDDETTEVFDYWYCAGVGACDPQHITEETLADLKQPALVRQALESMRGAPGERHRNKFANALFTRLNMVKPSIKFRYLKAGFEIVGDNPQAKEARRVFDYYKDLVTEVTLETRIDGSDVVGHGQPFGLFVNLRHTREIERESGGFGRYLQNQNNNTGYYYYNFGRPLENYRDKFQDAARQALSEHFEVLSVTFQDEKVNSKATADYGWRVTPYAYILLKAKSAKIDKVPPLRLDLDFMDTSGYVVLPVESPTIPVDAAPEKGAPRPFEKLQITQTLDERQAKDGKLILEVKATARGLVPDLDSMLALAHPGFQIEKVDDQGVSVSKFDPDSDATLIDSERTWLVSFRAAPGEEKPPTTFRFASAKIDGAELTFQRYVDADLAKVGPEVELESRYDQARYAWLWWIGGGVLALAAAAVALRMIFSRPRRALASRYAMPELVTPFSVLGLLRSIQRDNGLPTPQMQDLEGSIAQIERHFFAESDGESVDLKQVAEAWIRRAT